jgi:predicted N-acyltransferase
VSRGFEPAMTWSAHWITDVRFREAVRDYLAREREAIDAYAAEVQTHVPYRERRITPDEGCA